MQQETNDPLIGQQLDEYRLEALLGQGGMARVYRGQDSRLRRYVAVKVIDTPFRAESEYTARFEREAQAIAQLQLRQVQIGQRQRRRQAHILGQLQATR